MQSSVPRGAERGRRAARVPRAQRLRRLRDHRGLGRAALWRGQSALQAGRVGPWRNDPAPQPRLLGELANAGLHAGHDHLVLHSLRLRLLPAGARHRTQDGTQHCAGTPPQEADYRLRDWEIRYPAELRRRFHSRGHHLQAYARLLPDQAVHRAPHAYPGPRLGVRIGPELPWPRHPAAPARRVRGWAPQQLHALPQRAHELAARARERFRRRARRHRRPAAHASPEPLR
mmetsp:Transcript_5874/g.16447  ORF Transcript_5874/g.16447 Transcript_5874/m.16447 type:complete len:230 (-) Transcript_5874:736-1425(-)